MSKEIERLTTQLTHLGYSSIEAAMMRSVAMGNGFRANKLMFSTHHPGKDLIALWICKRINQLWNMHMSQQQMKGSIPITLVRLVSHENQN